MATPKKAARVTVKATRNLDWLNEGEQVEMDREEWLDAQIQAGYVIEVDPKTGQAKDQNAFKPMETTDPTPQAKATQQAREQVDQATPAAGEEAPSGDGSGKSV